VDPPHPLRDALRLYLKAHPDDLARIARERPNGPLAMSYDRGRRGRSVPCRYDFVMVSPDMGVETVRYRYEEALRAGSDHALVTADLALPADTQASNP
jgi:endonuclease/exonuclease/phosphatase family metal-dependent hydrolase